MARPKIYIRQKPNKDGLHQLLLSYFFNGSRLEYYTGVSIKKTDYVENYFKGNKKPIKQTAAFAAQYNSRLKNIEADAVKLATEAKGDDLNSQFIKEQLDLIYKPKQVEFKHTEQPKELSFIKYFENAIQDSKSGKRLMKRGARSGQRYGLNAIKNYSITLSALNRYLKYNGKKDLKFAEVNQPFYDDFLYFCYEVETKEKATFAGYIKDIKTLMSEADLKHQTINFTKPTYEAHTIYLTSQQIDLLANLDLSDIEKYIINDKGIKIYYPTLERVRDLFLIGAYTGLRFSDFSVLNTKSINGNFIEVKQIKTGGLVTIPIMSKLKPVLAKYANELPTISNQKFNDYIKHVAKLAGLCSIEVIKNTKGNKLNTTKAPLYSLITSHCCRRSYATNMFKAGVPPMLIMGSTGHKTESSFLKYIRSDNKEKAKLLAETMIRLGL